MTKSLFNIAVAFVVKRRDGDKETTSIEVLCPCSVDKVNDNHAMDGAFVVYDDDGLERRAGE